MLSPNQAMAIIFSHSHTTKPRWVDIREACGSVLVKDVRATDCLPRFDNSAMDGYAVRAEDVRMARENHPVRLRLLGKAHAGASPFVKVHKGDAVRISTGAPIPLGANAVVMQEYCEKNRGFVFIRDREFYGGNIRCRGEEIQKGQIAIQKGTLLNPGSIAWLSTMGISKVLVFSPIKIGILRSGNEVVETTKAKPHQIRDAHGISLSLALNQMGLKTKLKPIVPDKVSHIARSLKDLFRTCDVVITTGGVSVGDRDFFIQVANKIGLKVLFHKISQKPGKPLAFGKYKGKLWFGLPGNPLSSLMGFYIYIQPALKKMMGIIPFEHEWVQRELMRSISSDPRKTRFLMGRFSRGKIIPAEKQGSHCLSGFVGATGIVCIEPSRKITDKGALVSYIPIF